VSSSVGDVKIPSEISCRVLWARDETVCHKVSAINSAVSRGACFWLEPPLSYRLSKFFEREQQNSVHKGSDSHSACTIRSVGSSCWFNPFPLLVSAIIEVL
jgi:hypothetical protein